jgi:hypothetical protein
LLLLAPLAAAGHLRGQLDAIAAARPASGTPGFSVVYSNDFESPVGAEWSSRRTDVTPNGNRRFLGQFGSESVHLKLDNLPAHSKVTLSFELFLSRSWDGLCEVQPCGPDIWEFGVAGRAPLLHTTFGNGRPFVDLNQSFPDDYPSGNFLPRTRAIENNTLGYTFPVVGPNDSVYRLCYTVDHSAGSIEFDFAGSGLQQIEDESWGLDNLRVAAATADAVMAIAAVDPPALCLTDSSGSTDEVSQVHIRATNLQPDVTEVFFSPFPDGQGGEVPAVAISRIDGDTLACTVRVRDFRAGIVYFPFLVTSAGNRSLGFGPRRHPDGLYVFVAQASSVLRWEPPTSADGPPLQLRFEPSCLSQGAASQPAAEIRSYRIYESGRPGVAISGANLYAEVSASQQAVAVASGRLYVVTAVGADGVESSTSAEVGLTAPRITSVSLKGSKLRIDGSGFTDSVTVLVNQFAFVREARVSHGVRVVQGGELTNGMSLDDYLRPGRSALVTVRNSTGATSQIRFTP